MPRILLVLVVVAVIGFALSAVFRGEGQAGARTVAVERGTVVRNAVAVGEVTPDHVAEVNTRLTGFVRRVHVELGQRVAVGTPLVEVWPVLSDEDLLRAERALQAAREGEEAAAEYVGREHLLADLTRILQGARNLERMQQAAERSRRAAEERLRLLREGHVEIDGRVIDFVVRAPVTGHVLRIARPGDPVTPASSYGTGTVVATIGDLDRPVFRGTVDEIDVGHLRPGMAARVSLGALPEVALRGEVEEVGLLARRQDNAAVFDVRIALEPPEDVRLRAGYSAVAEVELTRAADILILPERVLHFRDGEPFVRRFVEDGEPVEQPVDLGVSDGLTVEIRNGLAEGDRVLDPSVAGSSTSR